MGSISIFICLKGYFISVVLIRIHGVVHFFVKISWSNILGWSNQSLWEAAINNSWSRSALQSR